VHQASNFLKGEQNSLQELTLVCVHSDVNQRGSWCMYTQWCYWQWNM